MHLSVQKFGSHSIRIAICFLLLVSNSQGMVLCIGADGKAELKPALHHKKENSQTCSHTCGLHRPTHDNSNSSKEDSTTKLTTVSSNFQSCTDIPFAVGNVDTNSISLSMQVTAWITPDSINDITDCLSPVEIKFTHQFSDFPDTPLGMLRTVILLT